MSAPPGEGGVLFHFVVDLGEKLYRGGAEKSWTEVRKGLLLHRVG
jgi:hypothetical protein